MKLRTREEVKSEFARKGISPRKWALANDIKPFLVYQLLAGTNQGSRGESHRAAVLLGLKEGEIVALADIKGALQPVVQADGMAPEAPKTADADAFGLGKAADGGAFDRSKTADVGRFEPVKGRTAPAQRVRTDSRNGSACP